MKIMPICMVKNEGRFISLVLRPFINVFGKVIVADTGSTDNTVEQVKTFGADKVLLLEYSLAKPEQVGLIRGDMQKVAESLDYTHVFLVDGDELYPTSYVRFIADNPMPEKSPCGFTSGFECIELPHGECWLLNAKKCRDAVFSVHSKWRGIYPFEGHSEYDRDPKNNYYWKSSLCFYHLHTFRRSDKDADVHMRIKKQKLFNMQERPDIHPVVPWLQSFDEYKDT